MNYDAWKTTDVHAGDEAIDADPFLCPCGQAAVEHAESLCLDCLTTEARLAEMFDAPEYLLSLEDNRLDETDVEFAARTTPAHEAVGAMAEGWS